MNYYDVLGIFEDANDLEIKSNYRKLAMKYHPDKNPNDKKSEEMFRKVTEAYETLSNKGSIISVGVKKRDKKIA